MTDVPRPEGVATPGEKSSRGGGLHLEFTEDELGVVLGALTAVDPFDLAVFLKGWLRDEKVTPDEAARFKHAVTQRLLHS